MWKFVVLILLTTTAESTVRPCIPSLGILQSVTVLERADHDALLYWGLSTAVNLPFRSIKFNLQIRDRDGMTDSLYLRFENQPFVYRLKGLSPGSWYLIRVQAVFTDGFRCRVTAAPVYTSFITTESGASMFGRGHGRMKRSDVSYPSDPALTFYREKQGDEILLEYHLPMHPFGPTNYYDLIVRVKNVRFEGFEARPVLNLSRDHYDITPMPNTQHDTQARTAEKLREALFGNWRPRHPLEIVIVRKAPGWVRLAILFRKPTRETMFESENELAPRDSHLRLKCGLADYFGFPRFEGIQFEVRRCWTHGLRSFDTCGPVIDFDFISNVGAPSRVREPYLRLSGKNLLISWEKPETPNGPIDGYELRLQTEAEDNRDKATVNLGPSATYYELKEYSRTNRYVIGIAAYNFDLKNKTLVHFGEWIHISPPDTFTFDFGQELRSFVVIVLAIFIAVVSTRCCFWLFKLKQSPGPAP